MALVHKITIKDSESLIGDILKRAKERKGTDRKRKQKETETEGENLEENGDDYDDDNSQD